MGGKLGLSHLEEDLEGDSSRMKHWERILGP